MGVGWKSSHSERSTMTTAVPQTTASHAIGETTPALLKGTISANLDATIARFGDREALIDRAQGIRWTYAAFGAEVDRLARALMAVGLAKGDRIGIWAPNCAEWTVTQYATAKLGAILVNINPSYRTHELSYVLRQAGIRMLVIAPSFKTSNYVAMTEAARHECPDLEEVFVIGESSWTDLLAHADEVTDEALAQVAATLDENDPINIQYTSGTTGFRRARRCRTATSSTTAISSARSAATPRRTGSASPCPSTTASGWSWATSRPPRTGPAWSSRPRASTPRSH